MTTEVKSPSTAQPSHPSRPAAGAMPAPRRRRRWIWITGVLLVVLGVSGVVAWRLVQVARERSATGATGGRNALAGRPIPVITATVRRRNVPVYLNALGTVAAYNTVTLRTRIDGQLMKVGFTEGQIVKKDDVLFTIDDQPYQVQLTQANAQKAKDQASLDNANADVTRYTQAGTAVPRQVLETAQATARQLKAAVEGDDSQIAAANLNIKYCTILAPITGTIGLRMVDEGNMVHAGDASGLAVITQLDPIVVNFSIQQDHVPQVINAQRVAEAAATEPSESTSAAAERGKVPVEAWNRDDTRQLGKNGILMTLDNQIDVTTASVRLKSSFENPDNTLGWLPNQFVNIHMLVDTLHDAVVVNSAALQRNGDQVFVYLVKPAAATQAASAPAEAAPATATRGGGGPELVVEQRPVTISDITDKDETVVLKGLEPGDVVVTDGVDKLVDGSKVSTRAAASQPGGGGRPGRRGGGASTQPGDAAMQPASSSTQPGTRPRNRARGDAGGSQ